MYIYIFFSIAIERDQYLRDKVENVETYKNALSAQVRSRKHTVYCGQNL